MNVKTCKEITARIGNILATQKAMHNDALNDNDVEMCVNLRGSIRGLTAALEVVEKYQRERDCNVCMRVGDFYCCECDGPNFRSNGDWKAKRP